MTAEIGDVLHGIVTAQGSSVVDDPRRLRAMLKDLAGSRPGEISLLLSAVDAEVPHKLLDSRGTPVALLEARLTEDLEKSMFLTEPAARWAVQVWAFALGLAPACPPALGSHPPGEAPATAEAAPGPPGPGGPPSAPAQGPVAAPALIQPSLIHSFSDGGSVTSVAFSLDGALLATGQYDRTPRLWDIVAGRCTAVLKGHKKSVNSVRFSHDGKTLATCSDDGTARLWEVATGRNYATFKVSFNAWEMDDVALSPDGKTLATGSQDATVRRWDVATFRNTATSKLSDRIPQPHVRSVAFSLDGSILAAGLTAGVWGVHLLEVATWGKLGVLPDDALPPVAFSPDGAVLATGGIGSTVWLWDTRTWRDMGVLEGHSTLERLRGVTDVAFSPDGTVLASAGNDGTARLWDWATGRQVGIVTVHAQGVFGSVRSVAFSPDGTLLATGGGQKGAQVWRLT